MTTVGELGERALLARLLPLLKPSQPGTLRGPGDDAAILRMAGTGMAVSTDAAVEGVHFDLRYLSLAEAGVRALAASLGDLAATGATARAALLGCGLRPELAVADVEALFRAMAATARRFSFDLVGGDLVASPRASFFDFTVLGEAPANPPSRTGANEGELLVVTGDLGGARAGLHFLSRGTRGLGKDEAASRFRSPPIRLAEGRALVAGGVRVLTDISDGLAAELRCLADANPSLRFVVESPRLPLGPGVTAAASAIGETPAHFSLVGGEDFELLACVAREDLSALQDGLRGLGCRLGVVGRVEPASRLDSDEGRVCLDDGQGDGIESLETFGYEHFAPPVDSNGLDGPANPA